MTVSIGTSTPDLVGAGSELVQEMWPRNRVASSLDGTSEEVVPGVGTSWAGVTKESGKGQ